MFKSEDIEEIIRYTALELKGLVNMLDTIRTSLLVAIEGKPIELSQWYGAGAIANASLKLLLGEDGKGAFGQIWGNIRVDQWEDPDHFCNRGYNMRYHFWRAYRSSQARQPYGRIVRIRYSIRLSGYSVRATHDERGKVGASRKPYEGGSIRG